MLELVLELVHNIAAAGAVSVVSVVPAGAAVQVKRVPVPGQEMKLDSAAMKIPRIQELQEHQETSLLWNQISQVLLLESDCCYRWRC